MALLPHQLSVEVKPSPALIALLEDTAARIEAMVTKAKTVPEYPAEPDADDVTVHLRQDGKEWRVLLETRPLGPGGGECSAHSAKSLASAIGWAAAEALLLTGEVKR